MSLPQKIQTYLKSHPFPNHFDQILLESIEYCGFGSWKNISSRLVKNYKNVITQHKLPINVYNSEEIMVYYCTVFSFMFDEFKKEYEFDVSGVAVGGESIRKFYEEVPSSSTSRKRKLSNEKKTRTKLIPQIPASITYQNATRKITAQYPK